MIPIIRQWEKLRLEKPTLLWKWKIKIFGWLFCILLVPFSLHGRMASDFNFFGHPVQRRYYPEEFSVKIIQNPALPFYYQKINSYFFSYQGSPSFVGLKVYLTKEEIFSKDKILPEPEDLILATYQRQDFRKGAFEIFTRTKLPSWTKTLSFWIFDLESGHDAYLYIKTQKKVQRYFIGRIQHKGWKNFKVSLDPFKTDEDPEWEKIKFFNRKGSGGANDLDPLIKIGHMEAFSQEISERDLFPFFTLMHEKDFIWTEKAPQRNQMIRMMRLQKGQRWDGTSTISFFVTLKKPAYLEIYGNSGKIRSRFFALQTPYLKNPGRFRIDIQLPKDLDNSDHSRDSEFFFWGMGVFPAADEDPELKLENVMIWPREKS